MPRWFVHEAEADPGSRLLAAVTTNLVGAGASLGKIRRGAPLLIYDWLSLHLHDQCRAGGTLLDRVKEPFG